MTRGLDQSIIDTDVPTSINPADAAQLLARLPLADLPRMSWTITEMGGLIGHPPPHAKPAVHRSRFAAWVQHLGLVPDPEKRRLGQTHLRAQGVVDGVLVTVWSAHRS